MMFMLTNGVDPWQAGWLVEVRSKRKRSQEWFSKQLAELKRSVREAESAWL